MSRAAVRQAGEAPDAGGGALIAGLARAPSALSPWTNLDGALERSHVVLRADARGRFITAAQERAARGAAIRIRPYPAADRSRAADTRRSSCASSSATSSAATIRPTGRCSTTFVPELQDAAERAVADGLRAVQRAAICRRRSSRSIPQTGDMLAIVGGRDFRAVAVQPRDAQPAAAGLGVQAVPVRRRARARLFAGVDAERARRRSRRRGPKNGRRATPAAKTPDALTLRAALIESNNRAATALQQRVGTRPVLRLASRRRPARSARRAVAVARHRAGHAARPDRRVRDVPERRLCRPAARDRCASSTPTATPRSTTRRMRERVISRQVAFQMVSMLEDVIDRGTGVRRARLRHPRSRSAGRPARPTTSRTPGSSASRRRSSSACGSDSISRRPIGRERTARATRCRSGPTSCAAPRAGARRRTFTVPAGLHEEQLCRVSYLRPVEGCPVYTEYFKDGDDVPSRLCPITRAP